MTNKNENSQSISPRENDVVSGAGNSVFAAEAGEGPGPADGSSEPEDYVGRQDGGPTIWSHDLGDEGMPAKKPVQTQDRNKKLDEDKR